MNIHSLRIEIRKEVKDKSGGDPYTEDDWNPDAHISLTLTVEEVRFLDEQLFRLEGLAK